MQPKPYAKLQLIRTLNKLKIVKVIYESTLNGWSRKTFDDNRAEGAHYIGNLNYADDDYPDNRWIKFDESKLRNNRPR